jgi:hypothetical protein
MTPDWEAAETHCHVTGTAQATTLFLTMILGKMGNKMS